MTGRYGLAALLLAAFASGAAVSAPAPMTRWVPAWGSAQMVASAADAERIVAIGPVTIRQVVHLSAGGTRVRVRLSNVAGDAPLRIDAAALARGTSGVATVRDGAPLTFAGARSTVIPPGAEVYSDALPLATRAGDDLAISLFLAKPPIHHTGHPGARATNFVTAGEHVAAATLPAAQTIGGWWDLADVEVSGGRTDAAIVAIGDSITDGRGVRDDANTRWTDVLARRLSGNARTAHLALVNAGIGGNHILTDGLGPSLLARFHRDVIARPNVRYAIVFEGVNDLGGLTREAPVDTASQRALYDSIAAAYRELAARAHAHGITLIGATITPLVGNDYYHATPPTEATRQRLNTLIRNGGIFDAVIDFDAVVRDPAHPDRLFPAYDTGDHLHPNEAGYRAMGDAVALRLFGG